MKFSWAREPFVNSHCFVEAEDAEQAAKDIGQLLYDSDNLSPYGEMVVHLKEVNTERRWQFSVRCQQDIWFDVEEQEPEEKP